MSQELDLKEKFGEMSTASLMLQWEKEDRLDWAERILQTELLSRGITQSELDGIVSRREEFHQSRAPSERETIVEFGIIGRFVALLVATAVGTLLSNTLGSKAAALGIVAVAITYMVVFGSRITLQLKNPTSRLGCLYLVYLSFELVAIGIASIIFLWSVFATTSFE